MFLSFALKLARAVFLVGGTKWRRKFLRGRIFFTPKFTWFLLKCKYKTCELQLMAVRKISNKHGEQTGVFLEFETVAKFNLLLWYVQKHRNVLVYCISVKSFKFFHSLKLLVTISETNHIWWCFRNKWSLSNSRQRSLFWAVVPGYLSRFQ